MTQADSLVISRKHASPNNSAAVYYRRFGF